MHRVGQTKETTVYRYVAADTIEAAIARHHETASVGEDDAADAVAAQNALASHFAGRRASKNGDGAITEGLVE